MWKEAIQEEMRALYRNETWELVEFSPKKAGGYKWVFIWKFKANGTIGKYKAKLVIKWFTQTYDIDYWEMFTLVAKMNKCRFYTSSSPT